jgi:hypothetical protein
MKIALNPERAERQRQFALKNQRRREVRKMGREAVLANREMGRILSTRLWPKGKRLEGRSNG